MNDKILDVISIVVVLFFVITFFLLYYVLIKVPLDFICVIYNKAYKNVNNKGET